MLKQVQPATNTRLSPTTVSAGTSRVDAVLRVGGSQRVVGISATQNAHVLPTVASLLGFIGKPLSYCIGGGGAVDKGEKQTEISRKKTFTLNQAYSRDCVWGWRERERLRTK